MERYKDEDWLYEQYVDNGVTESRWNEYIDSLRQRR